MSLPHYFLQEQIISAETQECFALELSIEDAKHMKVARMTLGEHLAVIDASQDYFECEIVSFEQGYPLVRICQKLMDRSSGPKVTLVQGLAKGEKMELVIRHGTELGIRQFIPLKCERSIMKIDEKKAPEKIKRWAAIVKSAAMQSGQTVLAQIVLPQTVKQLCAHASDFDAIMVCWEEAPTVNRLSVALEQLLSRANKPAEELSIAVVVGPEGGLSSQEVNMLMSCHNASLVSLGASILRTETAGIVAPSLVLYTLGALGGYKRGESLV